MNPTTAAVATGVVVITGRWAKKEKFDVKIVLAVTFLALMLALLSEGNPKLGGQFGTLILVGAVLFYGKPLFDAVSKAVDNGDREPLRGN